jgi:hypothetical protein
MTRSKRRAALKEALHKSFYDKGITHYVLLTDDNIIITKDEQEAIALVHEHGYRVYAKCEDGYMIL